MSLARTLVSAKNEARYIIPRHGEGSQVSEERPSTTSEGRPSFLLRSRTYRSRHFNEINEMSSRAARARARTASRSALAYVAPTTFFATAGRIRSDMIHVKFYFARVCVASHLSRDQRSACSLKIQETFDLSIFT